MTIAQDHSSGGTWLAGSGFLMQPKYAVTTGHNLGDGEVTIRTSAGAEHQAAVAYDGRSDGLDLAVLRVSDDLEVSGTVGIARVNRATPVLLDHCWAVGFPRFMRRRNIFGRRLRDTVQITGVIAPASGAVSGLLRLQVADTPSGMREGSQWQGLSGAVVFVSDRHHGDLAVGVVIEHGLDEGPSALTVLPFTAIDDLGRERRTRVWGLLGASLDKLPVLPRTQDQQDAGTLLGAAALLDALPVRRAYFHGDCRVLRNAAQGMTDMLAILDAGRAMAVAFSLAESAQELRDALAIFGTTPPAALRRAVLRLIVLNKDYAEDFGEPHGLYSYFPRIGEDFEVSAADSALFNIPADDSFAAFQKLAVHLASSCVRLVAVREAALDLIAAITDAYPILRTHGEDTAFDIRSGIYELQQVQHTLARTADLVGLVVGQSDTETRRATLRALAERETGDIARLLSALAAVPLPRAWYVTPAPDNRA
ncbi:MULTISPECIES: trypsin-like peptidase domain-containing protein [unclassified Streptomyces]|uniref:trypsin-like peptidase domain-containing protein n=1 Tax=unclassified Streptomyces TaxID=2593676 RepID=UPI000F5BA675|nr:trypsin-like peptidase domain-containing protein [Streptomyces sp. ADI95-17]WSG48415.1 trypsin-like peptidase domain-containing protein [Streptomyces sp. NBC_01732]WSW99064.1 trypsin-like peptidase domain-containing protein [Streptomyces sp. NBC_00987]